MIRLENILKISLQEVLKTSRRRLQNVLKMSWRHFCKTSCYGKTSWRRLEDVWPRRMYWSWPRRLLKMKTEDVFKTSSSRRVFGGYVPQQAFFLKRTLVHSYQNICFSIPPPPPKHFLTKNKKWIWLKHRCLKIDT